MDIEGMEPFTRTLRCVEQDPSLRRFKQIAIGFENPAAKRFVSRRSHRNEVFECSARSVVYVYPTMPPGTLLLMQKLILHKTKSRRSWATPADCLQSAAGGARRTYFVSLSCATGRILRMS